MVDPNVIAAKKCKVLPIEFVVRGYITGSTSTSLWTVYKDGSRNYCGNSLPENLLKNEKLERNLLTPTTKEEHHDRPITPDEIVSENWLTQEQWDEASAYAMELFSHGQKIAAQHGLILVDTKYEFGSSEDGRILLIDEIHTPDSSRYWLADDYEAHFEKGEEPRKLDKEYVRTWLADQGFTGEGKPPALTDDIRVEAAARYIEVAETFTGEELPLEVGPTNKSIYQVLNPFV